MAYSRTSIPFSELKAVMFTANKSSPLRRLAETPDGALLVIPRKSNHGYLYPGATRSTAFRSFVSLAETATTADLARLLNRAPERYLVGTVQEQFRYTVKPDPDFNDGPRLLEHEWYGELVRSWYTDGRKGVVYVETVAGEFFAYRRLPDKLTGRFAPGYDIDQVVQQCDRHRKRGEADPLALPFAPLETKVPPSGTGLPDALGYDHLTLVSW